MTKPTLQPGQKLLDDKGNEYKIAGEPLVKYGITGYRVEGLVTRNITEWEAEGWAERYRIQEDRRRLTEAESIIQDLLERYEDAKPTPASIRALEFLRDNR